MTPGLSETKPIQTDCETIGKDGGQEGLLGFSYAFGKRSRRRGDRHPVHESLEIGFQRDRIGGGPQK